MRPFPYYLETINADYIDELLARYHSNPESVDASWRYFFDGMEMGSDVRSEPQRESYPHANGNGHVSLATVTPIGIDWSAEVGVARLIEAYRTYGKHVANLDPLKASAPSASSHPALELSRYGLGQPDLTRTFQSGKILGLGPSTLSQILKALQDTYCGTVGIEVTHMAGIEERKWLESKIESGELQKAPDAETRKYILKRLTESECFEKFLHTRYVAQKRFSVEGGEGIIPSLDAVIENGAELGLKQIAIGMAHRGRLNILTNTMGKKPEYMFTEFEGTYKVDLTKGEGDVKYHMGYSRDTETRKGKTVHLSLAANPSHLEFVNPVVTGVVRAKQTYLGDHDRAQVAPILIHGDAAFAGQGVCYETLNFCSLKGYSVGGTLHYVINNQVGFTTFPHDSRSTDYCTDVAKMLDAPIFHVNGDDADALWNVSRLAIEFRQKFKKDVFIDIVCYRKHGHNEGDEPAFTQPLLYKTIKAHATPREVYAAKLSTQGVVSETESKAWFDTQMDNLAKAQQIAKSEAPHPEPSVFEAQWKDLKRPEAPDHFKTAPTRVSADKLRAIAEKINSIPSSFHLHSKLARFFDGRLKAVQSGKGLDWGNGEALAFATLLDEGTGVRLSGQDAERGTFTHRHAVVNDFETGEKYTPFHSIREGQAKLQVHNSHLSETGVLGFEYGYSIADPKVLTIWEAQFGDFANGAQVIIDQFIAAAESKWQRMSGLVLLLPHGFEGQGPEHSSARLERFLQLCGKYNLVIANLTTPAQIFHALRRQMKRDFRKPLVIMSPKSLLRHPLAISDLKDFTDQDFQMVIDDETAKDAKKVLLCSGKVYYDLIQSPLRDKSTAIVRLEQLYPYPEARLTEVLSQYSQAKTIRWVQEEPRNMGAWSYIHGFWSGAFSSFKDKVGGRLIDYVGREICAAPAVGSAKVHEKEQKALIEQAFSE